MKEAQAFLAEIEAAATAMNIAPSTLCVRAVKNSRIPRKLATDQAVTLETLMKVRAWIAENSKMEKAS